MKSLSRYLLGIAFALALGLATWLPLRAQEATSTVAAPPAAEPPVAVPPAASEKSAKDEEEATPSIPDEALSADNSISFPVDI